MGSEMCIRDRQFPVRVEDAARGDADGPPRLRGARVMWVVLLDGVRGLCVSARGIFEAEQPKRARIPSQDVGLMPRCPRNLRSAAEAGSQKAER